MILRNGKRSVTRHKLLKRRVNLIYAFKNERTDRLHLQVTHFESLQHPELRDQRVDVLQGGIGPEERDEQQADGEAQFEYAAEAFHNGPPCEGMMGSSRRYGKECASKEAERKFFWEAYVSKLKTNIY